jgi:rhodanese-related sulfurtransferase
METVSREQARKLIAERPDLAVIEVLGEESYNKFHIPGAKNVPLDQSFRAQIREVVPNLDTPVLLYCMDAECDASPKAAQLMDRLGYQEVYDYEAGKMDWKEAGLHMESSLTRRSE